MTMSPTLPSVLQRPHGNSISMYRALKQILNLLEQGEFSEIEEDIVRASIDDVETMLKCVE